MASTLDVAQAAGLHLNLRFKLTSIELVGGIFCHICNLTFGNRKDFNTHYTKDHESSSEIVYTCVVCHKQFVDYSSFRNHCYMHSIKGKFKCDHCGKPFSKMDYLMKHIKAKHTFKCNKSSCNKQFSSQKDFHLHNVVHNSEINTPPFPCHYCSESMETMDDCEMHIDKHYSFVYICPICEDTLTKENSTTHLAEHFGTSLQEVIKTDNEDIQEDATLDIVGGILCHLCSDQFKNRSDFEDHFNDEHKGPEMEYSCNICKKRYTNYSTFYSHCYNHVTRNKFECETCCSAFPRLSLLVIHMEGHGAAEAGPGAVARFACSLCPASFSTERRLCAHHRSAHGAAPLRCPAPGCELRLPTPRALLLHRREHSARHCRLCGLRLAGAAAAARHLRLHQRRCVGCPVCGGRYGSRYLAARHAARHWETTLHVCGVCGRAYASRTRLRAHGKTHGARPHRCATCGKGFTARDRLQQHLNVHSGARPYACPACPCAFANYSNWHKHLRRKHRLDPKLHRPAAQPPSVDDCPSSPLEAALPPLEDLEAADCSLEELTDVLLSENLAFAPETPRPTAECEPAACEPTACEPAACEPAAYEYGPDFGAPEEHQLPHIDPLLTLTPASPGSGDDDLAGYGCGLDGFLLGGDIGVDSIDPSPKWEPPVVSNFYVF